MGQGIDLAKDIAPEHAQVMENFRDQLIIILLARLGGKASISIEEVNSLPRGKVMMMNVRDGVFNLELREKD